MKRIMGRVPRLAQVVAIGVLVGLITVLGTSWGSQASAQNQGRALSVDEVVAALRDGGVAVENLQQQPVAGSPSGAPATESAAYAFSVPGVAPSGGRILVFSNGEKLNRKAAWFRRSGANVVAHHNILVWLDPAISAPDAARYQQALKGLR